MADKLELTTTAMAVLKALASTFRGMSKKFIAQYASKELDFEVHVRNDLDRLLPALRDAGLISLDKANMAHHRGRKGRYRRSL